MTTENGTLSFRSIADFSSLHGRRHAPAPIGGSVANTLATPLCFRMQREQSTSESKSSTPFIGTDAGYWNAVSKPGVRSGLGSERLTEVRKLIHRLLLTVWTAGATAAIFSLAASPAAVAASTPPARPIAENVVPGERAPLVVGSDTTWSASSSCYYPNCTAAHQDGEGNIPSSSSHYCSKQDRDGDGIACEW
jgi:hypothetical protein